MNNQDIFIVAARRTPIGAFQGLLKDQSAVELSAIATKACISDSQTKSEIIDTALIGCVLTAGIGQAPARQAALASKLNKNIITATINKVCGSGMKTVMLGHDLIQAGSAKVVLAGGMESMSSAPYLLPKIREGYRMGNKEIIDHMFYDGLQNPYDNNMMGFFADATAKKYGFSRESQDEFARESFARANRAAGDGSFKDEIAFVSINNRGKESHIDSDEEPLRFDPKKIQSMRPAFTKDGTVTAGSSSTIADGAASLILASSESVERNSLKPIGKIIGHAEYAHEPEWFTTAPVGAIKQLFENTGWSKEDVDLYEINEAFACVTMAAMLDIEINHEKVNVNGGACALGHPIGASGTRVIVTLLNALRNRGLKRGIASLCIGGGEAVAIAIEAI
ncbi:MAG: acetyl-CoA C-acyltransferase [Pseudomonadota bacterium]|nr:acetyl-CoA C-acyltransferase [Pseudomonadota bacterium]